jgi:hypothetical protein
MRLRNGGKCEASPSLVPRFAPNAHINLDISIRNSSTLSSFKNRVKVDINKTPKYYNEDPRKLSILHTRLRHQCSSLNADLSKIHIINNFKCNCG